MVALAESGEQIAERVLVHRVKKTHGDSKADVAAAVETAMDEVAAEIGPDREIGGTAVAYRDAAERRAIVTRLASGPWQSASLVSTKSAHLSAAGVMTWLSEFDDLLIGEVVPGHQAFTLVDRGRNRVLAATSQAGDATKESLGAAVAAVWDQLEAAAVRPDAVVLIGSGAAAPAVRAAVDGFGAPVLPCRIAASAPAIGAALSAMADVAAVSESVEQAHRGRGMVAMVAAASVVAGGLVAGGLYAVGHASVTNSAVVADARVTADSRAVADGGPLGVDSGSASGSTAGITVQPGWDPGRAPVAGTEPVTDQPTMANFGTGMWSGPAVWGKQDRPLTLDPAEPMHESESPASAPLLPGTGIPGPTTRVGIPDGLMLFPGETLPPPAGTPESYTWWDNHVRLMMQWAAQQFTSV